MASNQSQTKTALRKRSKESSPSQAKFNSLQIQAGISASGLPINGLRGIAADANRLGVADLSADLSGMIGRMERPPRIATGRPLQPP